MNPSLTRRHAYCPLQASSSLPTEYDEADVSIPKYHHPLAKPAMHGMQNLLANSRRQLPRDSGPGKGEGICAIYRAKRKVPVKTP